MEIVEINPGFQRDMLWREAVGHELRLERQRQVRTQSDVATDAGISTQYLSEIERGRKEPSSEILESVLRSLGLRLVDMTDRVTVTLRLVSLTSLSQISSARPEGVASSSLSARAYDSMLLAA